MRPTQRHLEKHAQQSTGEQSKAKPTVVNKPSAKKLLLDFGHYQAKLKDDLARLTVLVSVPEKAALKADLLKTYRGFVEAYVKSGEHYSNPIAVQVMIWLFDTLEIEPAIQLALYLIKQKCHQMPKNFDRDMPTFVCDVVYDWAAALLKQDQSASPYLDDVVAVLEHDDWSLHPLVKSKMYAMLAKHKDRDGDSTACIVLCDKAEAVNPEKHGTKNLKATATKKLREQQTTK